ALRKAMELLFGAGMFIDEKSVVLEKIVATTLQENEPALRLLERVGFKREQDGPAGVWMLYENPEDGSVEWSGTIVERVLKKGDLLV
ncbi:MAG: GNAT family protein, partial [Lachnospiraceae bacterium]|nr:GNAT family protein [Lachnospiraceae bacterium]